MRSPQPTEPRRRRRRRSPRPVLPTAGGRSTDRAVRRRRGSGQRRFAPARGSRRRAWRASSLGCQPRCQASPTSHSSCSSASAATSSKSAATRTSTSPCVHAGRSWCIPAAAHKASRRRLASRRFPIGRGVGTAVAAPTSVRRARRACSARRLAFSRRRCLLRTPMTATVRGGCQGVADASAGRWAMRTVQPNGTCAACSTAISSGKEIPCQGLQWERMFDIDCCMVTDHLAAVVGRVARPRPGLARRRRTPRRGGRARSPDRHGCRRRGAR